VVTLKETFQQLYGYLAPRLSTCGCLTCMHIDFRDVSVSFWVQSDN